MGFISRFKEEYKHEMACRADDARRAAPEYYQKKYHRERRKRHRIEEEARQSQAIVRRNTQMELASKEQHIYKRGWWDRGLQEKANRDERTYQKRQREQWQAMESQRAYEKQMHDERRARQERATYEQQVGALEFRTLSMDYPSRKAYSLPHSRKRGPKCRQAQALTSRLLIDAACEV